MQVAFTGQVFQNNAFGPSITEVFGLAFAAIVLILTFGSLLAAGMPLISAIVGVLLSVAGPHVQRELHRPSPARASPSR